MTYPKTLKCVTVAIVMLMALAINGRAQDSSPDHSCSANIAAGPVWPHGKDGSNFNMGWNLQAGGGFAVSHSREPNHGYRWYVNVNYLYAKLEATKAALATAIALDPTQLTSETSAPGSFSAVKVDPTLRRRLRIRWFRLVPSQYWLQRRQPGQPSSRVRFFAGQAGVQLGRFRPGGRLQFWVYVRWRADGVCRVAPLPRSCREQFDDPAAGFLWRALVTNRSQEISYAK